MRRITWRLTIHGGWHEENMYARLLEVTRRTPDPLDYVLQLEEDRET